MKLTERDIEIVRFVNEFGFCEMRQIERMFSLNKPRNYEIMRRLIKGGYIRHKRIFIGRHGVYYASPKGASLTDLPPIDSIPAGQYEHHLAIMSVYLKLIQQHPDADWISERQLKHDKFHDGIGKRGHISDGILMFPSGVQIAVEVEMSVKGRNRIDKILKGYASQFSIKEIWYYCSPSAVSVLKRLAKELPFIKIYSLREFLS